MHASDETSGHEPVELPTETRDTGLTDEALDRAPGKGGYCPYSNTLRGEDLV